MARVRKRRIRTAVSEELALMSVEGILLNLSDDEIVDLLYRRIREKEPGFPWMILMQIIIRLLPFVLPFILAEQERVKADIEDGIL